MRLPVFLIVALTATLSAAAVPALAQDAAAVAAAERAFAADGGAMGVDRSFLKWSTPDAVMIAEAPRRAHDLLDPAAAVDPAAPKLFWYPQFVGVARSGELGFSTGPVELGGVRRGHYFTVWRKQADGGWKWIYDGGVAATSTDEPGPDAEPAWLPTSGVGSASPEAAMAEVRAAEAALALAARTDQKAAHLAVLAPEARVYVAPLPPAKTPAAMAETLAGWPPALAFEPPLGGGASEAGDLAWVYGKAAWTRDGEAGGGHYVRVWQKREGGWKLVFAQLLPAPPQPAAAGG